MNLIVMLIMIAINAGLRRVLSFDLWDFMIDLKRQRECFIDLSIENIEKRIKKPRKCGEQLRGDVVAMMTMMIFRFLKARLLYDSL
jgi:hypothetical protein